MKLSFLFRLIIFLITTVNINSLNAQSLQALEDSIQKYAYENAEKAIYFLNKANPIRKESQNWSDYALGVYMLSEHYFHYLNDWEKAKEYLDQSKDIAEEYLDEEDELYGYIWNHYGNLYDEKGDYRKSIDCYKRTLAIDKKSKNPDPLFVAISYMNVGSAYHEFGDYEEAILYYKSALTQNFSPRPGYENPLIDFNTNAGLSYYKIKDYESAQKHYNAALKQILPYPMDKKPFRKNYMLLFSNIAVCKQAQGKYQEALAFLYKKLNIPNLTKKERADTYKHIGTTLTKQGKYDAALDTLTIALKLRREVLPEKHHFISLGHQALGDVYIAKKDYQKALRNYQSAIVAVVYDFESKGVFKNPKLENVVHEVELLKSLAAKAKTLQLMKKYKESLKTYQLCSQLIDQMRNSFQHSGSKLFFMEQGNAIYEAAIATALAINDKEAAFEFAEKSKAMLLLEAMRGIEARFGLPDDLVRKEDDFNVNISYYERKVWEERQRDESNEDNIKKWESLIFDLKASYASLKDQLKKNYPDYYQLQYNSDVAAVKDIQRQLLNSKTAMISYFIGEQEVYIFTITKKGIDIISIDKTDNLTDWVNNMRLCLQRDSRITNYHATYYETAFQLYKIFLAPGLKDLPEGIEKLILIPDDQLNFIPFEILLTTNPNLSSPRYELSKVPYLIKDYQISYGYSGTLLLEGQKRRKAKGLKGFGGFVPNFGAGESSQRGCDGAVLGNLTAGRDNIATIKDIMNGKLYFDDEATLEDFKTLSNQYKILHLCTHACAEMDFKDTRIYFSDKELLAFELYNMPLNAQLAVLSACETGIGELKRGEGVMSLARAFMYSGCPSVVTSLWSVDDKSTSEIMRYFYENLKSGMTKDAALHQAKITYLDGKGIEESHPYYWSGFVHIGNTEALFGNYTSNWIWWIGGVAMIGLFGLLSFRRRKE